VENIFTPFYEVLSMIKSASVLRIS
jgi:hypothetical protein